MNVIKMFYNVYIIFRIYFCSSGMPRHTNTRSIVIFFSSLLFTSWLIINAGRKWNKMKIPRNFFSAGVWKASKEALSIKSNFDLQSYCLYFWLHTLAQPTRSPARWYLSFDYYRRTAPFVVRRSYLKWKIEKHIKCRRPKWKGNNLIRMKAKSYQCEKSQWWIKIYLNKSAYEVEY